MAERRMFAKTIIDSDAFIDMPVTARLLYYDLSMRADDDGFVNSPKKIMRMIGASQDDMSLLVMKKFVIPFESGVVVIKHWRIHNYIRKDTYNETKYKEEKAQLELDENNAYTFRQRSVDGPATQVRLGKVSIGKVNILENTADVEPIILNDNSEWKPTVSEYEEYSRLYPGVDIDAEFRNMRAWCIGNPTKRKTRAGVKRFVNAWLSKEQNSPKRSYTKRVVELPSYMTETPENTETENSNIMEDIEKQIKEMKHGH